MITFLLGNCVWVPFSMQQLKFCAGQRVEGLVNPRRCCISAYRQRWRLRIMNGTCQIHLVMTALHPAAWEWTGRWHEQQRTCRKGGRQIKRIHWQKIKIQEKRSPSLTLQCFTCTWNQITNEITIDRQFDWHTKSILTYNLLLGQNQGNQ